ncbi:caspase family protein [Pseudomonas sp. KnCO4]|uniref:caspase family protein n=1 Tax=Pseudomonas sp. KnCO4 TaxID=3381355 RepID=UPI003877A75E
MAAFGHLSNSIWLAGLVLFGSAAIADPQSAPEPDLARLPAWAQEKIAPTKRALVIGINDYVYAKDLRTPKYDAEQMAATLKTLDPNITLTLLTQGPGSTLGRDELLDQFELFRDSLRPGDIAVVYFSGHGLEIGGINYLVPANADVSLATQETAVYISLPYLTDQIQGTGAAISLFILDACRSNPFSAPAADDDLLDLQAPPAPLPAVNLTPHRYLTRKTPGPGVPRTDFLVFFAAEAGRPAYSVFRDDPAQVPSIFTRKLLRLLAKEKKPVATVFGVTAAAVARMTEYQQTPFVASNTGGEVMFRDNQNLARDELEDWFNTVIDAPDNELISSLPEFLDKYPAGPFSAAARKKLALLESSRVAYSPTVVSIERDVGWLGGSLQTPALVSKQNTTAFAGYDVNVRNAPSAANSEVLTSLRKGQQIEVLSGKAPRGWAQVMLDDGQVGYVGSVSTQNKVAESISLPADQLPGPAELATINEWRTQLKTGQSRIEINVGKITSDDPTRVKRGPFTQGLRIRAKLMAQGVDRSFLTLRLHSEEVPADTVNISLMKEGTR